MNWKNANYSPKKYFTLENRFRFPVALKKVG